MAAVPMVVPEWIKPNAKAVWRFRLTGKGGQEVPVSAQVVKINEKTITIKVARQVNGVIHEDRKLVSPESLLPRSSLCAALGEFARPA
ncbi:hypothetical protein HNP46_004190 [Pseudomonas nitritireducens]|uniref:Uncharacterized protein n=1 Tax=Pseudomonas nitroreducens TaxID=46680 RepID=A0A7W7P303_PSENT|nr:hypothetical protein [Pseudomonas nitritireducens]MBB4865309.1 hypothetical protein [Pseudomonas nitritireducens]